MYLFLFVELYWNFFDFMENRYTLNGKRDYFFNVVIESSIVGINYLKGYKYGISICRYRISKCW